MGVSGVCGLSDFQENGHYSDLQSAHVYFARMAEKRQERFIIAHFSTKWYQNKGFSSFKSDGP